MSDLIIPYPKWHFTRYKIMGTNPKTNRKKTAQVFVLNDNLKRAEEKSGLINIYYVRKYREDPTEAQLSYATSLGIPHLSEFDKADYSCLISIAREEYIFQEIPIEIAEQADNLNIFISPFSDLTCIKETLKNLK